MSIIAISLLTTILAPTAMTEDVPWIDLFDGQTLNGWTKRGGKANYHVEDGAIVGTTVPRTPNTFLCTDKHYGDFILELEYKVHPELNSGVQIRSNSLESYHKGRVHGYQVEIDPSPRAWSAGIYEEGRRGWLHDLKNNDPAREAFEIDDWNHYRVECRGDSIKTWINGVAAADLVDSMTLSGFIGLQVHGVGGREDPLTVRFRDIRIKDLGKHTWQTVFDETMADSWQSRGDATWAQDGDWVRGTHDGSQSAGLFLSKTPFGDATWRIRFRAVEGVSSFLLGAAGDPLSGWTVSMSPASSCGSLADPRSQGLVASADEKKMASAFKEGDWNIMTVSNHNGRFVVHVNNKRAIEVKELEIPEGLFGVSLPANREAKVDIGRIERLVAPSPTGS